MESKRKAAVEREAAAKLEAQASAMMEAKASAMASFNAFLRRLLYCGQTLVYSNLSTFACFCYDFLSRPRFAHFSGAADLDAERQKLITEV